MNPQELRFLLTGPTGEVKPGPDNPTSWLTDKQWEGIRALSELPSFNGLSDFFLDHSDGFKAVYDAVEAHEEPFPGQWNDLTGIQVWKDPICIDLSWPGSFPLMDFNHPTLSHAQASVVLHSYIQSSPPQLASPCRL